MNKWISQVSALWLMNLLLLTNHVYAESVSVHAPLAISELVIIDEAVAERQWFYRNLKPGVEIKEISSASNGLLQLNQILSEYQHLDALHIVSHASDGEIFLGNSKITSETLRNEDLLFDRLNNVLDADADLLFYGCNLASGEKGKQLLSFIADKTGADIAASTDLTGAVTQDGDWDLEFTLGKINTVMPFDENELKTYAHIFPTFTGLGGDNSGGSGFKSLTDVNWVVSNDFTADSGDIYWDNNIATNKTLTLKADGVDAAVVDVSALTLFSFVASGIHLSASSTIVFRDDVGTVLQTMTLDGVTELTDSDTDIFAFFDNNTTSPVTGVAQIDFNFTIVGCCVNGNNFQNLTFKNISYSNVVAPNSNTSPAISIANGSLAYSENAVVTQVDSLATLSDDDGDADWDGGTLVVQITANNEAADELSIPDDVVGDINTLGSNIRDNTTVIGSLSASEGSVSSGTALTITFNSNATNALVQQVVRAIHYRSSSEDPGTLNRTITFTATDASAASVSDTRTLIVTALNDEPTLSATGSDPTFTEGGGAQGLFSSALASTVESVQSFSALTLTVNNVNNGSDEVLSFDGSNVQLTHGFNVASTTTNNLNVSVSLATNTATLSFSGATLGTVALQTLINAVSYTNNSQNPNTSNRVITLISLSDSGSNAGSNDNISALAIASTVSVVGVDDVPTASSVSFSGTLQAGELLTRSYSYADVDNDIETSSTFKWYASDDAGGTNKTQIATTENFTLTASQVGKYISFEVTPVNANASGSAVESSINSTAIIAADTAPTATSVSFS
ncbi:MAG: DUF4347 domain-containing protein, partial [Pseudomonadales bacterium]|nr:DUF4347 domain-containing protein [Pseudomonadales bacterium]